MEVIRRLSVSSEEFFNALKISLVNDAKHNANLHIKQSDIKAGLTYNKNLKTKVGKEGRAKVIIVDFEDKKLYRARFESSIGDSIVTYEVLEEDNEGIEILYSEDYESDKKLKNLNFKILDFLLQKNHKKRANASLSTIENYIIEKRKE